LRRESSNGKLSVMSEATYHLLESALVDLVRVGSGGNGAGVRQLTNRLLRSLPKDAPETEELRTRLTEAMVGGSGRPSFRSVTAPMVEANEALVHWSTPNSEVLPPLYLGSRTQSEFAQLLLQWSDAAKRETAGLSAANTVLLSGPPGVGKTLLAHHIAAELGLPLATVNLAEVITSLLGGTGKNLRDAMQAALDNECVLLMDEFDAVAKRRDDTSDIGELKRIVNVMLLELDQWPADRLLIAATNHAHLLDAAVIRRFEMAIEIELLSGDVRFEFIEDLLGGHDCERWALELVSEATAEMSPAEIEGLIRSARRESLTSDLPLERALVSRSMRRPGSNFDRDLAMSELSSRWNLSNRQIGRIFGVSHPTVGTAIKRVEERGAK